MREEVSGSHQELRQIAPGAHILDGIHVPNEREIKTCQHDGQRDGANHRLQEVKRHVGHHVPQRGAVRQAKLVDLAAGQVESRYERLELPGDEPVKDADPDSECRVVEGEKQIAQAQQVAATFARIALGRLLL